MGKHSDFPLHELIINLSGQAPTSLLTDFDWLATKQSAPFLPRLRDIVVIGRCKWIPDSPFTGKDNAAWCLFDRPRADGREIHFFCRADSARADRQADKAHETSLKPGVLKPSTGTPEALR